MSGTVTPLRPGAKPNQVGFERAELGRILDLYGRMVAAGHWRDYAIHCGPDAASFAAFRRAAERPEFRIEKRPALRLKQGQYAVIGAEGQVLRRGHDLAQVLRVIAPKPRVVE